MIENVTLKNYFTVVLHNFIIWVHWKSIKKETYMSFILMEGLWWYIYTKLSLGRNLSFSFLVHKSKVVSQGGLVDGWREEHTPRKSSKVKNTQKYKIYICNIWFSCRREIFFVYHAHITIILVLYKNIMHLEYYALSSACSSTKRIHFFIGVLVILEAGDEVEGRLNFIPICWKNV